MNAIDSTMKADPQLLEGCHVKLAIMGKMAAGKTFASTHLVDNWGGQAWTTAERIKQISHALIDQNGDLGSLLQVVLVDQDMVEMATRELLKFADTYQVEPGNKPRRLYQEVGQILRDLDPSTRYCWEEDLERRLNEAPAKFTIIDIRARESFQYFVGERGFDSLLISAPEDVRRLRMQARDSRDVSDPTLLNHVSETDVDSLQFDFEISNLDDDQARLFKELDQLVIQLAERARRPVTEHQQSLLDS
jgi:hypothetical protein